MGIREGCWSMCSTAVGAYLPHSTSRVFKPPWSTWNQKIDGGIDSSSVMQSGQGSSFATPNLHNRSIVGNLPKMIYQRSRLKCGIAPLNHTNLYHWTFINLCRIASHVDLVEKCLDWSNFHNRESSASGVRLTWGGMRFNRCCSRGRTFLTDRSILPLMKLS